MGPPDLLPASAPADVDSAQDMASTTVAEEEPDRTTASSRRTPHAKRVRRSYGSNKMRRASETSEGQHIIPDTDDDDEAHDGVPSKSSLSVKTQHESLSLRTSFRSQLQLGIVLKSVQFDKISIREYPVILGDSPSTSRGVPISIGWEYGPECTVDLDAYETTRVIGGVCERRTKSELRVPSKKREEMLGHAGFSKKDMRDAAKILIADKKERRSSLRTHDRMQKIDPLLTRVMAAHAKVKKAWANQRSEPRMLLYSDRTDPLNASIGNRGRLISDTVIFLDLDVDPPGV
ncbi:hypothetical protein THAOC_28218 [Thalassiosira oceanica]|uniref:Uncharacterized protein n=1 Tax=Thalassiosira oceanica TaxID=159749 RepID=K0RGW3_THAOC|nr:hypothetical protein THAOC_28218 [Thalassiosira oceanica]|eukprot:EJK52495.1 hypothetical protein THAOC_28218 [Thalassiosira oceanica]